MYGKYYRLSQRMTGIHYVSTSLAAYLEQEVTIVETINSFLLFQIFTANYANTNNYTSTFRLIGQMALTHLILLLLTNMVVKYKNRALMSSSQISVSERHRKFCSFLFNRAVWYCCLQLNSYHLLVL